MCVAFIATHSCSFTDTPLVASKILLVLGASELRVAFVESARQSAYILVTIAIIPTDIVFMALLVLIPLAFLGFFVAMDLVFLQK